MHLVGCSALPAENIPQTSVPSNYVAQVSATLKNFQDFASYSEFEISDPRWVHATTGWNWLTCVRYNDHGRRRIYAFFFKENAIVNGRYDILTDQCGAQSYLPFNVTAGTLGSPALPAPSPLY